MECKFYLKEMRSYFHSELIDTLWNVNINAIWGSFLFGGRINRYIMECKCYILYWCDARFLELIDTLWNVNGLPYKYPACNTIELIDTLWNVNFHKKDQ